MDSFKDAEVAFIEVRYNSENDSIGEEELEDKASGKST